MDLSMRLSGFTALLVVFVSGALAQAPDVATRAVPRVEAVTLASAALKRDTTYYVVLPEDYAHGTDRRYPMVLWLHGSRGSGEAASRNIGRLFADAMRAGQAPKMLVVFPDGIGQGMWVDAKDGSAALETFLVEDLLPHVDARFSTVADRSARLVEGGSMGGYGAARLAFKYPEQFGALSMLSAGPLQPVLDPDNAPIVGRANARQVLDRVFGGDPAYFRAQSPWALAEANPARLRNTLAIRMIVGADDPVRADNARFSAHLDALGISHGFETLPGVGHSPRALFAALRASDDYWAFFTDVFREGTPEAPALEVR